MPWVRLDDGFMEHPKIVTAGGDAAWLHVCALGYCNRNLTDGRIPKGVLERLSDRKNPSKLVLRLCAVGLWHDEGDHYRIHDYLDFQPTSEQIKAEREQARERQRRRRAKQLSHGDVTDMSQRDNGVSHGDVTEVFAAPDPTRPVLTSDLQKSVLPTDSLQITGAVDNPAHPEDPVSILSRRLSQQAKKDGFTSKTAEQT